MLANVNLTAEAEQQARAAVLADPGAPAAHELWGILLTTERDAEGAARELNTAVTLQPDFWRAHYELGVALAMKGDTAGATQHFRLAAQGNDPTAKAAALDLLQKSPPIKIAPAQIASLPDTRHDDRVFPSRRTNKSRPTPKSATHRPPTAIRRKPHAFPHPNPKNSKSRGTNQMKLCPGSVLASIACTVLAGALLAMDRFGTSSRLNHIWNLWPILLIASGMENLYLWTITQDRR